MLMSQKPSKTKNERAAEFGEMVLGVPYEGPSNAWPFTWLHGKVDLRHGVALRRILQALTHRGAKLADGHIVERPLDAVRWLLERAADEIEDAEGVKRGELARGVPNV